MMHEEFHVRAHELQLTYAANQVAITALKAKTTELEISQGRIEGMLILLDELCKEISEAVNEES